MTARTGSRQGRWTSRSMVSSPPVWRYARTVVRGSPLAVALVCAAFGRWLAPYGANDQIAGAELAPMSWNHILGTDDYGRDILSRLIVGAQWTILIVIAGVAIGMIIGGLSGTVTGMFGGVVDALLSRVSDVFLAMPVVAIGVMLAVMIGPGVVGLIIAIGLFNVGIFARVARGAAIGVRAQPFVEIARSLGIGRLRLLLYHAVPNVWPIVAVQVGVSSASAIILEATLSYLGLGIQPPDASWGGMLKDSQSFLYVQPVYAIAPGIAICLLVHSINAITDAARSRADHRGWDL